MKKKRYSEEQIIKAIKQHEAGTNVEDICRDLGISNGTFYNWRSKYAGLEVNEAKRLRELESENNKLKKLLAEKLLENEAMKDVLSKNVSALKSAYKIPPPKSTLDVLTDHLAQQGSLNIPGQP